MTNNKRIAYLDMARGIGMVLVVMGHIEYMSFEVLQGIYIFHMPLFFLISGILIWERQEEKKSLKELAKKKWKGIMIPYILFSGMILCIEASRILLKGLDEWDTWWHYAFQTICFQGVSVLWFLPALFISELLFMGLHKKAGNGRTMPGVCVLVILTWILSQTKEGIFQEQMQNLSGGVIHEILFMLLRNVFCVGFLAAGYYIGRYQKENQKQTWRELTEIIIYVLLFLGIFPFCKGSELRYMNIENLLIYFMGAILGSMVVLKASRLLSRMPLTVLKKVLEFYGRNSLVVMATHMELRILYLSILIATPLHDRWNNNVLFCTAIVLLVFIIEIPVIWLYGNFCRIVTIQSRANFKNRTVR